MDTWTWSVRRFKNKQRLEVYTQHYNFIYATHYTWNFFVCDHYAEICIWIILLPLMVVYCDATIIKLTWVHKYTLFDLLAMCSEYNCEYMAFYAEEMLY